MTHDLYERVLEELFEAYEDGREPTIEELQATHPGHADTVRRALEAAQRYRRARAGIAPRRPLLIEALAPGDRLGDFEVESPLARGGMGCVYVARQVSLGRRRVALKVLPLDSASEHGAARFEREALTLAGLHHPHLVEVYGVGATEGALYFAMRLVEGPTLRDVLARRAEARRAGRADDSNERRALVERLAEVADALAAVHAAGLVHRDVKPSNVVLEHGDLTHAHAVLVDFGLARPVDSRSLTLSGDSPATPSYAPPEQVLGREVDARADVFSLGVTLHDLLAARQPHDRPQASAGLEPLAELARAVDPDREWRYANAAELRDDLRAWLAGEPVSARRPPLAQRTRRWIAKHPRRIVQVALLVSLVVTAFVALARPMAWLSDARLARAAYERGDVRELDRLAQALPSAVPVFEARVAEALRRLRDRESRDSLARVRDELLRADLPRALFAAAESVGRDGTNADLALQRFFLAFPELDGLGGAERARMLELWCVLSARVFYERPVATDERTRWAEPYLAAQRTAWKRTDLTPSARLYLVTALGQTGDVSDAAEILVPWTTAPERTSEEARMGCRATQTILRRAHVRGLATTIDTAPMWTHIESAVRRWDVDKMDFHVSGTLAAVSGLVRTLLIVDRVSHGMTPASDRLVPPGTHELLTTGSAMQLGPWLECLAIAGDPTLLELAQKPPRDWTDVRWHSPKTLGRICVFAAAAEPGLDLATSLGSLLAPDERARFEQGRREAELELHGVVEEESLDDETKLGVVDADSSPELVPRSTLAGSASALTMVRGHLYVGPPTGLTVSALAAWPSESWWAFDSTGVQLGGASLAPTALAGHAAADENYGFWLMYALGGSRLELPFHVDADRIERARELSLILVTNGRSNFPALGRAEITVTLNGDQLETRTISRQHSGEFTFDVSARQLRAGTNTIVLSLGEGSTTPLRVRAASIRMRED